MLFNLLFILLLHTAIGENTDFNYTNHGKDWDKGACQSGKKQSPIILTQNATPAPSFLFGAYNEIKTNIDFFNTTTYMKAEFGEVFTMTMAGKAVPFKASDIRLRCQSEHVIHFDEDQNYTRFPLELQVFHGLIDPQPPNDKVAIAIHYEVGETADPVIQKIIDAEVNNQTSITIDLSYYIKRGNTYNYWMYLGSPTIPSCIDGTMNWIIIDKRFSITQQQYDYFKAQFYGVKQVEGNFRQLKTTTEPVGYYTFGAV